MAALGAVAALTGWLAWSRRRRLLPEAVLRAPGPWSPLLRAAAVLFGLFVLFVFLQTLPLGLRSTPERLEAAGVRLGPALSVYPAATRVSLTLLLAAAVPAFAAPAFLRSRSQLYVLAGALTVAGGAIALYALLNYLSRNALSLHFEPSAYRDRARGPFVNPNHFAAWTGLVLPLALSVLFFRSRSWKKPGETSLARMAGSLAADISRRYWKILAALAGLLMLLGVIFSASRTGIVAAAAGLAVFALMALVLRARAKRGVWWPIAAALVVLVALAAGAWIGLDPVVRRFAELEPSAAQRLDIWKSALDLFADFPAAGTGLGTFPHAFPAYQDEALRGGFSFPHNEALHLLCETGLAGFALLGGALLLWIGAFLLRFARADLRSDRVYLASGAFAGFFSLLLNGGTELSMRMPANLFLGSLLLGAATAALSSRTTRMRRADPRAARAPDRFPPSGEVGILS